MKKNMTWARNGVLFMALSLCALTTGAQEADKQSAQGANKERTAQEPNKERTAQEPNKERLAQEAEPTTFGVWAAQMQTIARNNASLRALHSTLQATRLANSSDNALPDPEAEVAYMFGSPKGVPNRTNVAVTQTLPWSVLTGHRSRLSRAANSSAAAAYRVAFQRVMGEADAALVSMVHLNRLCRELESRLAQARDIASMYEKKFKDGDISIIELNKVRLNASVAEAELQRAKADRHAAEQTLQALNGGQPLVVADTLYPVAAALPPLDVLKADLARSAAVTQAEASVAESEAAIKLAKTEGLPQLTVGFQGEYIKDNNYSGPSVGLSIPLWGNSRRKVKAARAEQVARKLDLQAVRQQQQMELEQAYAQAVELRATADRLRSDLNAASSDTLLRRSLEAGQLSLLDYLLEQSFYYSARTALLDAERDAQLALSELRTLMY